ncbi:MAG: phosphoketolase [Actinophytocola sp.]|nr:phosphoketolase [Actinophytocola sp.]
MTAQSDVASSDAVRRALDYLCLAQLYLHRNLLLREPLRAGDVVEVPSGHWGVCPPVNAVLAALGTIDNPLTERIVVHGAGHAAPSARAHAWLTGTLGASAPEYSLDSEGLRHLVAGFRGRDRFGSEITPLIPGQFYMGGQLGPALATAHGLALDVPDRLVIALIGDGEAETGATAAAWLGIHALRDTGHHGRVLPVVLLNGMRMGGRSLLSILGHERLAAWFAALGYEPIIVTDTSTGAIRDALSRGVNRSRAPEHGPSSVVIVTVPKGNGAPDELMGTPLLHKTPLRDPRGDAAELTQLSRWLAGYRPAELFTPDGNPTELVMAGLRATRVPRLNGPGAPRGCIASSVAQAEAARSVRADFGSAITSTLRALHDSWSIRVFSPDELSSNRIALDEPDGTLPPWIVEVLNEELCHLWAQGHAEAGGRSVVVSYEAFAPIVASLLAQHLAYRRLAVTAGRPATPSITYLLTSLGWHNTVSHGNPGLIDSVLATGDPAVHVYTPADPARAAAALTFAVRKLGRCSLVVASKHPVTDHPLDTLACEVADGYAVWPHLSDSGHPDLVLLSAGDIAATELTATAERLRTAHPKRHLRYVHVHDLTSLGEPDVWPLGMSRPTFDEVFPPFTPVLAVATCC